MIALTGILGNLALGTFGGLAINAVQWYTAHRAAVGIASKVAAGIGARAVRHATSDKPVKTQAKT